ncbi:MAG TPA: L,D-transpeptidase [Pseudonocardiaceae bacterium]|nr:L,D-transpeptidase [Pseudonocardiaceae bacterium]
MIRHFGRAAVTLTVAAVFTVLSGTVAVAGQSAAAPCGSSAAACINLRTQQAWLMKGGQVTYGPTPITSGKPGYRTPSGTFTVLWKDRNHRSRAFGNAPMPYSVFFTHSGIAFHQGSLKVPSHGCVHLGGNAAATFFNTLSVGQVVQVVG